MKKRILLLAAALCLLCSGCGGGLLEREWSSVTPHSAGYWENGDKDTLRADSYQDAVNAILMLVANHAERDAEYYHVQGNKKMRLSQPQTMMASEREIVQEAYAGDIIGVFDPGIFSIGDTITVPGKKFRFGGIPTFEPEHFMSVSPKDTMKRKQFVKGIEQIAQEGAIQIFKMPDSGFEDVVVGVVGTLQFDVFEYRMKSEYGVELRMSALPYEHLRLIAECPGDPKDLMFCTGSKLLEDFKGRKLIAFGGEWSVGFLTKHNPGLVLDDWLTVSK